MWRSTWLAPTLSRHRARIGRHHCLAVPLPPTSGRRTYEWPRPLEMAWRPLGPQWASLRSAQRLGEMMPTLDSAYSWFHCLSGLQEHDGGSLLPMHTGTTTLCFRSNATNDARTMPPDACADQGIRNQADPCKELLAGDRQDVERLPPNGQPVRIRTDKASIAANCFHHERHQNRKIHGLHEGTPNSGLGCRPR